MSYGFGFGFGSGLAASTAADEFLSVGGVPVTAGGAAIRIPTVGRFLTLTSPKAYRVFQRDGTNHAAIAITGIYTGRNAPIEARWGTGDWEVIATPTDGVFSGSLVRPVGQGTLSVRIQGVPSSVVNVLYVGIGDVFLLIGQSNGSGRGLTLQSWTHPTLKACMLGNDNQWKELADPVDSPAGQVDSASYDAEAAGSIWPLVATQYMAAKGWPVAFIPCCRGGQGNVRWWPGVNHFDRTTLYGSAMYRALVLAGGVKAAIYWAGEPGVDAAVTDYTAFKPIATAIRDDLGVPVMRVKLQYCTGGTAGEAAGVAAAVQYIWDHPDEFNSITGPDLSDIISNDGYHLMEDPEIQLAASRTGSRLIAAFS